MIDFNFPTVLQARRIGAGRHDDVAAVPADIEARAQLAGAVGHLGPRVEEEVMTAAPRRHLVRGFRQRAVPLGQSCEDGVAVYPPLGYDVKARKLVVNEVEAATVGNISVASVARLHVAQ